MSLTRPRLVQAGTGAVGRTLHDKLADVISVTDFGAVGDGVTDDTTAVQNALAQAISAKKTLLFEGGTYLITDTLTVENSFSLKVKGVGERLTILNFSNATVDKVFWDLKPASSNTVFSDMQMHDVTGGTSICFKASEDLPDTDGYSHYKDELVRCRITNFKTGFLFTTTDPTDGTTHAFLSEPMFYHTRFKNNRTTIHMQNIQAVDLTMIGTDIENDDAGETYTFIKDDVGGDYKITGGSFVGKGIIYDAYQAAGSSSLWQASKLSFKDSRFECRATHTGTLFKPVASAFQTEGYIQLDGCSFLLFTQDLALVDFGGKTAINLNNCKCHSGTLTINLEPTTGITGALVGSYYKSYGSIVVTDSYGFKYDKQTTSSYGTYEERYTCPVEISNSINPPSGSYTLDDQDFMIPASENYHQRGVGLTPLMPRKLVYNIDRPGSSFTDIKFLLPFGASPTKLLMYKHPSVRSTDISYKLYAVKDNADWVLPGTFAVGTDAIQIADSVTTVNKAGYLEFAIDLTSSYFDAGTYFEAGKGTWLEGKMFLELSVGAGMNGFVGVEYI